MQITYDRATLPRNWMVSDYIKYNRQNDKLICYDMIRKRWGGIRARHFLDASKSLIRSSQEIDSPVLRRPVRSQKKFFSSKLSFLDFDQIRLQPFISYFLLTVYTPLTL